MKKFHSIGWLILLSALLMGVYKIGDNVFTLGDGTDSDKEIRVNNGDANPPAVKYSASANAWQFSNNGLDFAAFGSGSGGLGTNYVSNSDFELNLDGWATFDDGALATPPEDATGGTGGAPAVIVFSQTTSAGEVHRGSASAKIVKSASDGQGEGWSYDLNIDPADTNKILKISGTYSTTANFAHGDLGVWMLCDLDGTPFFTDVTASTDGTNDNLVFPSSGAKVDFLGTFVSPVDETDLDCRLIFMIKTTSALAWDMTFDDILVGPGDVRAGAVATEWKAFTPTTSVSGCTINEGVQRQVGDTLEAKYYIGNCTWSGAGNINIDLPPGLTVDESKINQTRYVQGAAMAFDGSATGYYVGSVYCSGSDTCSIMGDTGGASIWSGTGNRPLTWQDGNDAISIDIRVPVAEYSGKGVVNLISEQNLTEWKAFQGNVSNATTATLTQGAYWRRVGDTLQVKGIYEWSGADATTANFAPLIPAELNVTVDESKLPPDTTSIIGDKTAVGTWSFRDDSATTVVYGGDVVWDFSNNGMLMQYSDGAVNVRPAVDPANDSPVVIGTEDTISWIFELPIVEWGRQPSPLFGASIASPTNAGLVDTGAQDIGGVKNFVDGITGELNGLRVTGARTTNSDCAADPCSLTASYGGGIASMNRNSTGDYTINFTSSYFSSSPSCVITSNNPANYCHGNGTSGTASWQVQCFAESTNAAADSRPSFLCIGPQ